MKKQRNSRGESQERRNNTLKERNSRKEGIKKKFKNSRKKEIQETKKHTKKKGNSRKDGRKKDS